MDTIWTIYLEDGSVDILKYSMNPELINTKQDYTSLANILRNDIYSPDRSLWDETVSLEAFFRMIAEGCFHKTFDLRFCNDHFGFEWHETFIDILVNNEGIPDRILLSSRNINDFRKAQIIETAVRSEYDYVIYIEASKNSYVMYTSGSESYSPPPIASYDYDGVVASYNRQYMAPELHEEMTEKLQIAHIEPILRKHGEYIVYGTMIENGVNREKKMRFSYYDREKNIWLMTRTDITEIKEERKQKKLLQEALQSANAANRAKTDLSGKSRALLPPSPLRTVRESFPSYGSSNSIFLFVVRNRLILSTFSFISLVAVVVDKLPYNRTTNRYFVDVPCFCTIYFLAT